MAEATTKQTVNAPPTSVSVPFDFSQPPIIEGFNPAPKLKDETFKEKFMRKTKENPFVPIGELHKHVTAELLKYSASFVESVLK